jgi:myosin-5
MPQELPLEVGDNCWWVQPGEIFAERSKLDYEATAAARAANAVPKAGSGKPVSEILVYENIPDDDNRFKAEEKKFKSGTWYCEVLPGAKAGMLKVQILDKDADGYDQSAAQLDASLNVREFSNTGAPDKKDKAYLCLYDKDFPAQGYDNMTEIKNLNEAELARNIKLYASQYKTFCECGSTLVAINAFKRDVVPFPFGKERMVDYANGETSPHCFKTAKKIFDGALMDGAQGGNQALIITGESGAGKTFNTRNILGYLAFAGKDPNTPAGTKDVTVRMCDSSNILDAFGNATMPRNDDSSRFGKLYQVYLSKRDKTVKGCQISPFLLEKSRVNKQSAGERNFHVFYMIAAKARADSAFKSQYKVLDQEKYRYLNRFVEESDLLDPANAPVRTSVAIGDDLLYEAAALYEDEAKDIADSKIPGPATKELYRFNQVEGDLRDAFTTKHSPDVAEQMIDQIWRCCSACLLLGQVVINDPDDSGKACVANPNVLAEVAELLEIDAAALQTNLIGRVMKIAGKMQPIPFGAKKANSFIKSIAGTLYDYMFNWIVDEVSAGIKETANYDVDPFVGVLDIFGFECTVDSKIKPPFIMNSFEQFCINLCNEQLQNKYQKDIMDSEKKVIEDQLGYSIDLNFNDNGPALTCLSQSSKKNSLRHVLAAATDALARNKSASKTDEDFDCKFRDDLLKKMKDIPITVKEEDGSKTKTNGLSIVHPIAKTNQYTKTYRDAERKKEPAGKTLSRSFQIQHYAGPVIYDTLDWCSKNNGVLSPELMAVFGASTFAFPGQYIRDLGEPSGDTSILGDFNTKLAKLMNILNASQCHFVRCIKANIYKISECFQDYLVLNQLRYTGMMDALLIRKIGYPFRLPVQEFMDKYGVLNRSLGTVEKGQEFVSWVKSQPIYGEAQLEDDSGKDLIALGTPKPAVREGALMMLKDALTHKMDSWRRKVLGSSGNVVQTFWRAAEQRRKYVMTKQCATQLGPVIEGVVVRQKFMSEFAKHYEPQDRQQVQNWIYAALMRQKFYKRKQEYESMQENLAALRNFLQNKVILEHDVYANMQESEANAMRRETDLEITKQEKELENAKNGVTDKKDRMLDETTALQARLQAKRTELEEARVQRSTQKSEADRAMEQLKISFQTQKETWKQKTDEAQAKLDSLLKEAPAIQAASDARLAEANTAHNLAKAVGEGKEDVIRQQQVDLLKEQQEAEAFQMDARNKYERQLVVSQEKFERLEREFHDIDAVHAKEVAVLKKSLIAQNWKLAQLHMSEQQSIEDFENLGLRMHFSGDSHGSIEHGKEIDILDAQIEVLKEQMTQSAESRLILHNKLDHLMHNKREVEEAWELAVREQDTTVERLTDALEKERRVSDKLEQACKQPGPPRHSRFDVAEEAPQRDPLPIHRESEPRSYVVPRSADQYTPHQNTTSRTYQIAPDRRQDSLKQEATKDIGLSSLNALYKGHGTVHVSQLEKLDSTTLGAALRLLH